MPRGSEVTLLLHAWSAGDVAAREAVIEVLYEELRTLATHHLRRERPDHSLPPAALVHEVFVRLTNQREIRWENRAHFFAAAGHLMRRVLVDHARGRAAAKRAGVRVMLDDADVPGGVGPDIDMIALDVALQELAALDPRQAQLVELRFFAGLTVPEAAVVMGVAPITVKRDWALAKAWLFRALGGAS
jgi:RNA polymerase sigma factor (TIGR02999 family)